MVIIVIERLQIVQNKIILLKVETILLKGGEKIGLTQRYQAMTSRKFDQFLKGVTENAVLFTSRQNMSCTLISKVGEVQSNIKATKGTCNSQAYKLYQTNQTTYSQHIICHFCNYIDDKAQCNNLLCTSSIIRSELVFWTESEKQEKF